MQESISEDEREKASYNRMASRSLLENEDSKVNRSRDSSSRRTSDAHGTAAALRDSTRVAGFAVTR